MRKVQRTFIKKTRQIGKNAELDNFGMDFDTYKEVEKVSFDTWLSGFDYADKREQMQEMIKEVYAGLSKREQQVFQLLSDGAVEDQIAAILKIHRSSVRDYRANIVKKFQRYTRQNGGGGTTIDRGL